MFLGYPKGVKTYKLWGLKPRFKKYIINQNVVIDETEMVYKSKVLECEFEGSHDGEKVNIEVKTDKVSNFLQNYELDNHVKKSQTSWW